MCADVQKIGHVIVIRVQLGHVIINNASNTKSKWPPAVSVFSVLQIFMTNIYWNIIHFCPKSVLKYNLWINLPNISNKASK